MQKKLIDILGLKNIIRAGWLKVGIERPESVASHSWGMSALALELCPQHLDLSKVLSLCIVHDIPEIIVGDLTPLDDCTNKAKDEHSAMQKLAPQWLHLFEEYAAGKTAEAKFVKQIDKLDMALQAMIYRNEQGVDTSEFIESARKKIHDSQLQELIQ
ncbi:MAG: HD domain-containing protein [archaeon]|nr:HD domain-containing protein [archaeon]